MGYLLLHAGQPTAKRLLKRIPELAGVEGMGPITCHDRVIRWGVTSGSDLEPEQVLNPKAAILATRSRSELLSVFRLNGIRCPYSENLGRERLISITRHYRVPVFNMRALALFRSDSKQLWLDRRIRHIGEQFREVRMDEDKMATRVIRLAIRAVHALGLDFGLVSLGLSGKGLAYVLDVSPAPVLKGRLLDLYVEAIRDWMKTEEAEDSPSFLMGTDLEFLLCNREGKLVVASKYLPRHGRVGCDALSIRRSGTRFPLAEIRPDPSSSPLRLVKNIEDALQEAKRFLPRQLHWLAGSMPLRNYGIGGHIHFSDLPLSSRLVKALDSYLALPVMMLEDTVAASRRRPRYGFLGDVRLKSHGGWEYRTLGSWLISPDIATGVVCLAYLVATHYHELRRTPFLALHLQQAFYRGDKETLRPYFEEVWRDIQQTSTYERYKDQLDLLADMVHSGESWDETADIRRAWGIRYPKPARTARWSRT